MIVISTQCFVSLRFINDVNDFINDIVRQIDHWKVIQIKHFDAKMYLTSAILKNINRKSTRFSVELLKNCTFIKELLKIVTFDKSKSKKQKIILILKREEICESKSIDSEKKLNSNDSLIKMKSKFLIIIKTKSKENIKIKSKIDVSRKIKKESQKKKKIKMKSNVARKNKTEVMIKDRVEFKQTATDVMNEFLLNSSLNIKDNAGKNQKSLSSWLINNLSSRFASRKRHRFNFKSLSDDSVVNLFDNDSSSNIVLRHDFSLSHRLKSSLNSIDFVEMNSMNKFSTFSFLNIEMNTAATTLTEQTAQMQNVSTSFSSRSRSKRFLRKKNRMNQ